jgi:Cell division protein FtsI/penicillin-binding protein 2
MPRFARLRQTALRLRKRLQGSDAPWPGEEVPSIAELRNVQADEADFRLRVLVMGAVVLLAFGLVLARLVYLQVVRHEDLAAQAESNRTAVVPIVPSRGLILDRNGVVLASNYAAYTLELTPSKVPDLEATLDALAQVVEIGRASAGASSACSKNRATSIRCPYARASRTKKWRALRRSAFAFQAWM